MAGKHRIEAAGSDDTSWHVFRRGKSKAWCSGFADALFSSHGYAARVVRESDGVVVAAVGYHPTLSVEAGPGGER